MTVKKRMILGFSIVISLILGVAIMGAYRINSISKATNNLYNHPYTVNLAASQIQFVLSECNTAMGKVAYGEATEIDKVNKLLGEHGKVIDEQIEVIQSQFLGDKSMYEDFLTTSNQLKKSYEKIATAVTNSNLATAKKEYVDFAEPKYHKAQEQMGGFLAFAKGKGNEFYANAQNEKEAALTLFYITCGIIVVLAGFLAWVNIKAVTKPIKYAINTAEEIATGNLNVGFESGRKDEIGALLTSIQTIVDNIKKASDFTEKIGQGEINAEFDPVGENDTLGHSLLEMRSKLQEVADEDEKRNWATRGLAIFGEILRSDSSDLTRFGQDIISKLIEYLDANQGGIFLLNDVDPNDKKMELISAYAYDRQKFMTKEVKEGEGLVGQSWMENDKIYITNVPDNYITIQSGLGDANPSSVLIMPLKENDDIYGMVEIASFNEFEPHEIEFMERLAQSIGATFKNLKTNIQTTKLLNESRDMQEMMSQQEEELRQNAEEMQATAEQVHKEAEAHKKESEANQKRMNNVIKELNARIGILDSMCLVSETDKKGVITKVNDKFMEVAKYSEDELIGQPHNIVRHPDMPAEAWKACWATIGKGEPFRAIVKNKAKDGTSYWVDAVIAPKIGEDGKPDGYIGVRYDITDQIKQFENYTIKLGDQEIKLPTA